MRCGDRLPRPESSPVLLKYILWASSIPLDKSHHLGDDGAMKRKSTHRASKPQTIRLDPDASRIVEIYNSRCGWSATRVVNQLVVVAWQSINGHPAQAQLFTERMKAAAALHAAQAKHATETAALRKIERDAAAKIKPPHLAELQASKAATATAK